MARESFMPDREAWNAMLEKELPEEKQYILRNMAITSRYASWYLEKPELFKWAGMAAFASRQVGFALLLFELMRIPAWKPEQAGAGGYALSALFRFPGAFASFLHTVAAERLFLGDLDVIRQGNNGIYRDIAWAHAAYLHGGIAEVESGCAEDEREFVLAGFSMIDEGLRILETDSASRAGRTLIREGNLLLLRHEQLHTLQPLFDTVSPAGRVAVSFGCELDFSCGMPDNLHRKPSFPGFAGYPETLSGMRSITTAADRWAWIEREVLPAWEAADASFRSGSAMHRQMLAMSAGESDPVRSAAMSVSAVCRWLGLG